MSKYLVVFAAVLCSWGCHAATVDCSPGQLESLLPYAANETTLKVNGQLDAADLYYIAGQMPQLTELDLSSATIAEYQGFELNGRRHYPADEIPDGVFAGSALRRVLLPAEGVTTGDAAFAASALQSVTLPANVTLGCGVFAGCPQLTEATVATTYLSASTFSDCTALTTVTVSGDCTVADGAFGNCTSLSKISGSEHISSIGSRAFAGCTALKDFAFGARLESIGAEAFSMSGLEHADLSRCAALESIGSWAFARCPGLVSATMPRQIAYYGEGLFFDCPALADFSASPAATAVGDYAFKGNRSFKAADMLTEGIETLGAYSLAGNTATYNIELPATLTHIGDNAMEGMSGLHYIYGQKLTTPPSLGADVWDAVNQSGVELHVAGDALNQFAAAEQWREFKIVVYNTTTDGPTIEISDIKGRFADMELQLDFGCHDVSLVELYNISGMQLIQVREPGDSALNIDTTDFADNYYIIVITLADGTRTTLKLAR